MSERVLDTIIVGGGPAGLSAALVLGRCLRRVLVCDAGHPRNASSKIFNGFLSRDGSDPAEFLQISRAQLQRYENVALRQATVVDAQRASGRITAILESGERIAARTLLIATGLIDELPAIENFREFYGKSAHSCPYCHGWEVRGQALAVVGHDQEAAELAVELLLWSRDVLICTDGQALDCDRAAHGALQRFGIRWIDKPIARLDGSNGELSSIRFRDGSGLPRQAIFFSPGQKQHSPLAEKLGCELSADDGSVQRNENTATSVPGVYAAGNCSRGLQLVTAAVAEGMQAAFAINNALLEADTESGALCHAASTFNLEPVSEGVAKLV